MSLTTIRVSEADFNPGEEIERLIESSPEAGGVASFVGVVRNRNDGNDVTHLTLEHYPAMTERALAGIVERAQKTNEWGRAPYGFSPERFEQAILDADAYGRALAAGDAAAQAAALSAVRAHRCVEPTPRKL